MNDADDHLYDKDDTNDIPCDGLRAAEVTSNNCSMGCSNNRNIDSRNSCSNISYDSYSSGYYDIDSSSEDGYGRVKVDVVDGQEEGDYDDNDDDESCYDSIASSSFGSHEFEVSYIKV